jgi:hypothetical protein
VKSRCVTVWLPALRVWCCAQMLPRTANLESGALGGGPPPEQVSRVSGGRRWRCRRAQGVASPPLSRLATVGCSVHLCLRHAPQAPSRACRAQDIPLAVPKKTRLYVEQTQREREQVRAPASAARAVQHAKANTNVASVGAERPRRCADTVLRGSAQAADMHRTFQRDLAKLRLTTARSYVKVLTDGQVRCRTPCGLRAAM